ANDFRKPTELSHLVETRPNRLESPMLLDGNFIRFQATEKMKRETIIELGVFAGLVALGVVTRLITAEYQALSNFTATGAAALFAGYYFRNRWVAILVPLTLMVVSNLALRQYNSEWQMVIVYAAFILPVILGFTLRGRESAWRIGGSAIATSVWFFLITN